MGKKLFSLGVVALFAYLCSPLFSPIILGAMVATLFIPWVRILEKRKVPRLLASGIVTGMVTLFFLLPSTVVLVMGSREAFYELQRNRVFETASGASLPSDTSWAHVALETPRMQGLLEKVTFFVPVHLDELSHTAEDWLKAAAGKLGEALGNFVAILPGMMVSSAVLVVSIYFFLLDGRKLVLFFQRNRVFTPTQSDRIIKTLKGACRSVMQASLISGAMQGVLEGVVCGALGVTHAGMIGVLAFFTSFIPVIGALPVTLGVAFHQFIFGHSALAVILLVTAFALSLLDNLIRPLFMRGSANLHPLVAFAAAFGGLQTLGFTGIFLGPIIAALAVVLLEILIQGNDASSEESRSSAP